MSAGRSRDGIPRRITALRRRLSLSQGAFAQRIGVTRNMVIRYEGGQAIPRAEVLSRLAREARVTVVDWLVDGHAGRDRTWEEAVAALRAVWPDAEKRRLVLEVLRRVR